MTNSEPPVFELLSAAQTNIDFVNTIEETDSFNMYTFMNIYTGGGVGIGDINNDGLEDIFFSGNRVSSKLYLNKGNLEFEDITESAGVATNKWCAGVAMVDINADGWLDIYVSVSGIGTDEQRANLLFENQGDGTFLEKAKTYGLDDSRQVMQTSFFDYDRDGDLDAYLIVNPVDYSLANVNNIRPQLINGESESTDRLYRNDINEIKKQNSQNSNSHSPSQESSPLGAGGFTDVSAESGILVEGYSLGVSTCDINGDDWPDIYVSNDFLTNDILYLNNQDGTFSNKASTTLNHTSFAGMGNDISDFNNDGLPDILVVDMLPEDNLRRQSIIPASSYDKFELTQKMGYSPQYTRNTLQLNNGDGTFSEIGQLAGIDKTDWSWSSLFADYDNDGDKDLLITNGFLRDVGNLDYISYQRKNNASPFGKKGESHKKRLKAIQDLGAAKIQNYVFENKGDLTFDKKNTDWGLTQKTCSNGAAYADLDLDGDLELVINNVNDVAFIYENKTNEIGENNYLKIDLKGNGKNPLGVGAKITIQSKNGKQYYQHHIYRGYESSVSQAVHFGLGKNISTVSLEIVWADGSHEFLDSVSADQTISLFQKNAQASSKSMKAKDDVHNISKKDLFENVGDSLGLDFLHQENDYVDFKTQPLLPHKHSQNGGGISVGDVNGDGLEDAYVGGAGSFAGQLFLQKQNGNFEKSTQEFEPEYEDMGSLFFDADGDGDLDLYLVSGGSSFSQNSKMYQDRLYENNGKGVFSKSVKAVPEISVSGSCVKAADFDHDGDLDLFIGGRVSSGAYPLPAQSYLLRNDSKKGQIKFTDISDDFLAEDGKLGMVTSALWTDYDNDGWQDLLVVGEWMSLQFFKNVKGVLQKESVEIPNSSGWWNSIAAGDFDQDGDTDYVFGNLGRNSRFQATSEKPVCVYAKDFDKNGRIDPLICQYIEDENYLTHPRDLLVQQINAMRVRFRTYASYGKTSFRKSFVTKELEDALVLKSDNFLSSYLENLGNGKFQLSALPMAAQIAPIFGMHVEDFDADGNLDVLLIGNSFATEVGLGRYDAFKGLVLAGDGDGNFTPKHSQETGFFIDSDGKGLSKLQQGDGTTLYLASSNDDALKVFALEKNTQQRVISFLENDAYAMLKHQNGKETKVENYYGSTYLSQSSATFLVDDSVTEVKIFGVDGEERILEKETLKLSHGTK